MSSRTRTRLVQLGSFVLAGVLLYLALRGVNLADIGQALREANYAWLLPLVAAVLVSHVLRAWRWQLLLEALPEPTSTPRTTGVSFRTAFYSLMIGYMVNYAAPRLGEVVRTGNLSVRERLRFSAVFGTVVVERILDVLVLALAMLSVLPFLLGRSAVLEQLFVEPVVNGLGRLPGAALVALTAGLAALIFMLYRQALQEGSAVNRLWRKRVQPIMAGFRDGLLTLLHTGRPLTLVASTAAMWFCYGLMAYLPLRLLGMTAAYGLTFFDAWVLMVAGAVGVAVPSPGGIGSYHFITIQSLIHLFGVPEVDAASYAVLSHGAQFLLYLIVGVLCLILQGSSLRALRRRTDQARAVEAEPETDDALTVAPGTPAPPQEETTN